MPRKKKDEELRAWLSKMSTFTFSIRKSGFMYNTLVIAETEEAAFQLVKKDTAPDGKVKIKCLGKNFEVLC